MTFCSIVVGVIAIWTWLAPAEVGKWLVQVQDGMAAYREKLLKKEEK